MIIPLERFEQVLNENGTPSDRAADFLEEVTRQVNLNTPIRGDGSPEGAVLAEPDQRYWDDTGKQMYFKDTGTGDTGWILV